MIKQREGDPKFPCWKWFWSLWTLWTRTVQVKEKRDPKSKQSKAKRDILKMRRVESLLVVFFVLCLQDSKIMSEKTRYKRVYSGYLCGGRKAPRPRKCELPCDAGCSRLEHSPLEFLPTAGNWEPSLNIEKLHVRTECVVDNLCSVKQTRVHFKKEKQSSQLNW